MTQSIFYIKIDAALAQTNTDLITTLAHYIVDRLANASKQTSALLHLVTEDITNPKLIELKRQLHAALGQMPVTLKQADIAVLQNSALDARELTIPSFQAAHSHVVQLYHQLDAKRNDIKLAIEFEQGSTWTAKAGYWEKVITASAQPPTQNNKIKIAHTDYNDILIANYNSTAEDTIIESLNRLLKKLPDHYDTEPLNITSEIKQPDFTTACNNIKHEYETSLLPEVRKLHERLLNNIHWDIEEQPFKFAEYWNEPKQNSNFRQLTHPARNLKLLEAVYFGSTFYTEFEQTKRIDNESIFDDGASLPIVDFFKADESAKKGRPHDLYRILVKTIGDSIHSAITMYKSLAQETEYDSDRATVQINLIKQEVKKIKELYQSFRKELATNFTLLQPHYHHRPGAHKDLFQQKPPESFIHELWRKNKKHIIVWAVIGAMIGGLLFALATGGFGFLAPIIAHTPWLKTTVTFLTQTPLIKSLSTLTHTHHIPVAAADSIAAAASAVIYTLYTAAYYAIKIAWGHWTDKNKIAKQKQLQKEKIACADPTYKHIDETDINKLTSVQKSELLCTELSANPSTQSPLLTAIKKSDSDDPLFNYDSTSYNSNEVNLNYHPQACIIPKRLASSYLQLQQTDSDIAKKIAGKPQRLFELLHYIKYTLQHDNAEKDNIIICHRLLLENSGLAQAIASHATDPSILRLLLQKQHLSKENALHNAYNQFFEKIRTQVYTTTLNAIQCEKLTTEDKESNSLLQTFNSLYKDDMKEINTINTILKSNTAAQKTLIFSADTKLKQAHNRNDGLTATCGIFTANNPTPKPTYDTDQLLGTRPS